MAKQALKPRVYIAGMHALTLLCVIFDSVDTTEPNITISLVKEQK
jgi:hypothetical protein